MDDHLAWAWMRRHERAFNESRAADMVRDYAPGATLEVHVDGAVVAFEGRSAIEDALTASVGSLPTRVERVVADETSIAAQICDRDGRTVMVSFWELRGDRIWRDVSIVTDRSLLGTSQSPGG